MSLVSFTFGMSSKYSAGIPHLVGKAQQRTHQPLIARRDCDDVFAAGEHDTADCHHLHLLDDVADDHKGILADFAVRRDVIGADIIEVVDFVARHELIDIDGLGAFERDRFHFLVGDLDVFAFGDLVTLDDVLGRDFLAGLGIDLAIADATTGCFVDLIEADFFALGGGRVERDGA